MSKYPTAPSWVERTFTRKTAMEIHKRHWKWQRGRNGSRHGYAYGLKRDGRIDEMHRFLMQDALRQ